MSTDREGSVVRYIRLAVWLLVVVVVAYFGFTGYAGYRVGTAVSQAKTHALTAIGAGIVGRDKVERAAIKKSKLPNYVVVSPTFWLLLRVTE
jgi:hypothetical protein